MAIRVPEPKPLQRLVRIDGHLLRCTTTNYTERGYVAVQIDHDEAAPIAHRITLSSMGQRYEDMQHLVMRVAPDEVIKPLDVRAVYYGLLYSHTTRALPEIRWSMLWWETQS